MEVKPGYKMTEVGVIPEDWDAPELNYILASTQLGGNYRNSERQTDWPLIKMGNLERGKINLEKLEYIDASQYPSPRDKLAAEDLLFNTRNTLDLVGKVALWRGELLEAYFNSNIMRMVFDPSKVSTSRFINYILNTPKFLTTLRSIAIGTTSVAAIYNRDLTKLKLPLPPKSEQEAIASALSDVDALIESLEQLIAKKRNIKQGAMQELLTGKRRLPGFSGELEVKRLGALLTFQVGFPFRSTYFNEEAKGVRLIRNRDLKSNDQIIYYSGQYDQAYVVRNNDILIGMDGDFMPCLWSGGDALLNQRIGRVLTRSGIDGSFLYYFLVGPLKKIENSTSSTTVKHLSNKNVEGIVARLPGVMEQVAIGKVLHGIDVELLNLESKLSKVRQLKQAMMQELLTGRIRLV